MIPHAARTATAIFAADLAVAEARERRQNLAERPIRSSVPFTPGSKLRHCRPDRGASLGDRLGQPFVVENRAGASGIIGTEAIARADPDGYTLGLANASTLSVSPNLMAKPNYDPVKDFARSR